MRYLSNFIEDRKILTIGGVGASSGYSNALSALGTSSSTTANQNAGATGMAAAIGGLDNFTLSQVAPSLDSTAAWGDAGAYSDRDFDPQKLYQQASNTSGQGNVCAGDNGQTTAAAASLVGTIVQVAAMCF